MTDRVPMRVVATAGHVDHGKSTLLRALTGMEPDRYEEERRRGMTLDLGFVWTDLPSGRGVAFVDVPGHARLVRTMLAGVGAVDLVLFVVAADEGWMPQSEEHLRILELVGAADGVIALTKAGAVEPEGLEPVRREVAARVEGTFLDGRPIVVTDAVEGRGLDEVRDAIDAMLVTAATPVDRGRPRLWVDRSFSIKGAGTVVTGTLTGGRLAVGDAIDAVDRGDRTVPARIRGLQSQGRPIDVAGPGERVAVNLGGIRHRDLSRGCVLVQRSRWKSTRRVDARIRTLAGCEVGARGALLAYVGTAEAAVRLRVLGRGERIAAGGSGAVRIWFPAPLPLVPGDRLVLRDTGTATTVAGGEVLDVDPVVPASRARPDRSIERVVAERGWVTADELERLTGHAVDPEIGPWVVAPSALAEARTRLEQLLDEAGGSGLDVASLDQRLRAVAGSMDGVMVRRGRVVRAGDEDPVPAHPWLRALEASPFGPPPPEGVSRLELRDLVGRGLVIEEGGMHFAATAVEEARRRVADYLAGHPEGMTMSELRSLLGTTRKYALPLAAALDRRGVTVRRADVRLPGRRIGEPVIPGSS